MKLSRKIFHPATGVGFGGLTFVLNLWAHGHPAWVERWYSRGFFQFVRVLFDNGTGRLSIPAFYLFWLGVLLYWVWKIRVRPRERGRRWRYWLFETAGFAGWVFGLFFWLWGFNYARIPLDRQIGLDVQPLDASTLWMALRSETDTLSRLRSRLASDTMPIGGFNLWPIHAEDSVRGAVTGFLAQQGFPISGRVRGRFIYPEGFLYSFGASGIYWPFSGEGNIEGGLHPLQKLPAMAHEMSHGYGVSDEGMCNFIAYAALADHPNAYLAYSARLDYWSTLASACRSMQPAVYDSLFKPFIPRGMVADIHDIARHNSRFQEMAPELRYQVYDSYLKAQGIASGMLNYEDVLMLVEAWKRKKG